ncbi:NADH-quinone oxidoreductase subunit E [Roseovarius ramblicola]|uniref:NADH-quinone oxidoreductase subunit E n=1 Tax=Roseovarius ramblicola TaxID=2022336 RepID=A0ABV5I258_9RHOB
MLRRLYHEQPESFAFTPANQAWAEAQITKYPEGRQASAIIALLWRAQEQEGWLSRPAIEHIAAMLDMAYIRALEVATFYFMFHLHPVGSVAHFQICGTTPCMLCGSEDLIGVCRDKIAAEPFQLSEDGRFSWEEVECLGACSNAPMAQVGKDYYEDLTPEGFAAMIDAMAAGEVPRPGPQNGRYASEPASGLTSLKEFESGRAPHNASVARALDLGDTIKRIDGTEVPLAAPWRDHGANHAPAPSAVVQNEEPVAITAKGARPGGAVPAPESEVTKTEERGKAGSAPAGGTRPATLDGPRAGKADDLKKIKGVGPKLEKLANEMGVYHFDQIANWTEAEIAWVDDNLVGFKGRVSRDAWVEQAKLLAEGKETEFSTRVKKGEVY